ncbi:hypothetical protein SB768_25225 [Burkholderia sp. SIMBA_043]|uniref:hypothetical protein n=1 Tax=Burkholderia TaxID=32008 RepID=UPI0005D8ADFB|nr:hypothetical protein [Burkholderia vietnamiensis]AJY03070.1 hypothetical protein AK36_6117 [Burkholderia vietnamiensis LMG 10929]AVR13892.1 hypothetical protein A8H33_09980 [Burkholderia vietnamiensis]KVM41707.1 hypothetical protein WJ57_29955 [Burkholderia vietnamiensis]KVS03764.1 hypothetical protein WK30_10320 [Burkholderia vietnamiensis]UBI29251.1 hypothetical protein LA325_31130 [Burkholderia vietnamiensis]
MNAPALPLTDPAGMRRALLNDDEAVRADFAAHLGPELDQLAAALAPCFEWMDPITDAADRAGTQQTGLAAAFGLGVLDDLLVASKLLLSGKLAAAGNVMRQVIEGIAMALLCAADTPLVIARKKTGPEMGCYWERAWTSHHSVQAHHALKQLEWNAEQLGVARAAVERLALAKQHYNPFSHCGWATIASRVARDTVGQVYLGGHFDEAKLGLYRSEMQERIGLCSVLPQFLEYLHATLETVGRGQAGTPNAAPHA